MSRSALFDDNFIARLEHLEIFSRNLNPLAYDAGYRGVFRGGEVEFAEHRAYAPGDDTRYIDWNVYGRLDRFVTKQFGADERRRTFIALDTSASMGGQDKFRLAVRLAAALGAIALFSGDILDAALLNEGEIVFLGERTDARSVVPLMAFLERVTPGGRTDYPQALRQLAAACREPSRLLLIGDLLGPADPAALLSVLGAAQNETALIHLLGTDDVQLPADGRLRLVDSETGEEMVLTVDSRERVRYARALERWLERVRTAAQRVRMDYALVTDRVSLEEALFDILRANGIVR